MRAVVRAIVVCCLALAGMAGPRFALADGATIFGGPARWADPEQVTASEDDLFPNPPYVHDWQSQSFFLIGRLNDGTFFVINLFHWQFSAFHSWGLTVLVTDPRGRVFHFDGGLPEEDKNDPPQGFSHRFGDNLFTSSGGEHTVRVRLTGFSCDLVIRNLLPARKPGDGWVYYDSTRSAYVHYAVPAPLATVNGSIIVFGNARSANGLCTWDSSLSVQPLGRPNSPQYSLRAFGDDQLFIDVVESFLDPAYGGSEIPVLLVARGSSWLFTRMDFSFTPSTWITMKEPPYPFPAAYHLKAAGRGWTLEGDFASARMYQATDVFQHIPPLIRELVSLFLKRPVLYRMVGEFQGTLTSPQGDTQALSMPAHAEYVIVK